MKHIFGKKVHLGRMALPVWAIVLALVTVAAVAGQAVGPVLSGSVQSSAGVVVNQTVRMTTAVGGTHVSNPVNVTTDAFTLSSSGNGSAGWSTAQSYPAGGSSVLLNSGTSTGSGHEGRIVIPVTPGTTLANIASISWREYNVAGYPPHADVLVDTNGDGTADDALVFEYAYNTLTHYSVGAMPYGALTGAWYQTFNDDGDGPSAITDTSIAWPTSGPPGPPTHSNFGNLASWKAGKTYVTSAGATKSIDRNTPVLRIEIEVDNWIVNSQAYVDSVTINGITYDLEPTSDLRLALLMKGVASGSPFAPTAADDFAATVNDEGTAFTVALETQAGQISVIGLKLDNQSGKPANAILEVNAPAGVDVAADDSATSSVAGKVTSMARLNKSTWLFALDSASVDDIPDIYIAVESKDDAAPGFYTITGRIIQVAN
ncbi:MAG: hypothetical protein HYY01_06000 [Chloroflexi bacterium]|nr:hypothetical protein [Chloroflexota bacterium]